MDYSEKIREAIKYLMATHHIKQKDISLATGVNKGNLSKMINGSSNVNQDVVEYFTTRFNMTVDELLALNKTEEIAPQRITQNVEVKLIRLEAENEVLRVRLQSAETALKAAERHADRLIAEKDKRISDLSEMLKTLSKKRDSNTQGLGRTKPARLESEVAEE